MLPGARYPPLDVPYPLKIMVTVDAVVHVQVVKFALVKLKRELHGQVALNMPAESVKVSNVITTAWPLSEN